MLRVNLQVETTICESSSFGRAQPCQGWGGRFEPGLSLHIARWCSGSTNVFGAFRVGSNPARVTMKFGYVNNYSYICII